MAENWLTKVARIAIRAAQGLTWTDKNNEVQVAKPEGKSNLINIQKIVDGIGNGGGDTGGGDNPDHPSAGADYYAGSLADGEITERELLWQGKSDPTKTTNVTLLKDVGAKFNSGGDGAFILVHLLKTVMTAGVKGATSEVKLNYDVNNVAKDGYFTTTSCYPIYIHASDLATHQELVVPLNGIGENLSGVNVKAPELHIKYNDDKTIDITSVTGYDNDGAESGATGANYDVVSDLITTFSTQNAIAQLPSSINFFTGLSNDDIPLSGVSEYYENSMDGLEVFFDDYMYQLGDNNRALRTYFDVVPSFRIPKEQLVIGNTINVPFNQWKTGSTVEWWDKENSGGWTDRGHSYPQKGKKNGQFYVKIMDKSINVYCSRFTIDTLGNLFEYIAKVDKVTPYKI
ncbi:hypothetical protein [Companilactobacillus jidongensis]|uniref:hypothetical protein n=1 Tax=Companilactobacillus jidongensis TaxID=2486006 RepID=UPI000F79F73D|nr:hypothetical protein [Companilactobacillus jidongensis]